LTAHCAQAQHLIVFAPSGFPDVVQGLRDAAKVQVLTKVLFRCS
jgi:hypothetical protein